MGNTGRVGAKSRALAVLARALEEVYLDDMNAVVVSALIQSALLEVEAIAEVQRVRKPRKENAL